MNKIGTHVSVKRCISGDAYVAGSVADTSSIC